MLNSDGESLDEAAHYWRADRPLETGRLVFEKLRPEARVAWALNILKLVIVKTGITHPAIDRILLIGKNPEEWSDAHDANSAARDCALNLSRLTDRSPEQDLLLSNLMLAYFVARLIYNATGPADPFDEDNGWYIASSLKQLVDIVGDDEFSKLSLSALLKLQP